MIVWFKRRLWPWLWLGTRLCVGSGRAIFTRSGLLGSACALGVFLILATMAVPTVSDAQRDRSYARTPMVDRDKTSGMKMTPIYDAVNLRPLLRVAVADVTQDSPRPPGVSTLPGPGEIVISPALRDLIKADEKVAYRFPQRVAGIIGKEGLVAPDELIAYVGVNATELSGVPGVVTGYKVSASQNRPAAAGTTELERILTPPRVVSASLALFLVLPLGVLLAICVRFDASRRDRRLAALRLVGASRRQAHLSAAAEMVLISGLGVVIGLLLFKLLARFSDGWHIGRFYWYSTDVVVPPARVAILLALVIALAVFVSAAGSRPAVKAPLLIRRMGKASFPSWWRAVPLVTAPVALFIAPSSVLTPFQRLMVLGMGIVSALLSLATVIPLVLSATGSLATNVPRLPVWATLAARRAAHSPAITPKLVTSALVALFIAGFGMMMGTTVRQGQSLEAAALAREPRPETAEAFAVPGRVVDNLRASSAIAGLSVIRRDVATGSGRAQHAVVVRSSCRDLAQLFDRIGRCEDGHSYRVRYGTDTERLRSAGINAGDVLTVQYGASEGQKITTPADVLEVSGEDYGCQCDIVVTTAGLDSGDLVIRPTSDTALFWMDANRLAPGIRFQGLLNRNRGFDSDAVLTLIFVGLTITVAIGLISFFIASIDRGIESKRRDAPLLAIGVPARTLRLAESAQLLVVIFTGFALGLALLLLTTRSWAGVFHMSFDVVVKQLLPLFASVIGGVLFLMLAVVLFTTRKRTFAAEDLRRE